MKKQNAAHQNGKISHRVSADAQLSAAGAVFVFAAVFFLSGRTSTELILLVYRAALSAAAASTFLLFILLAARRRARGNIIKTQELYRSMAKINEEMPAGLFRCYRDREMEITFANPGFYEFLGVNADEFKQKFSGLFINAVKDSHRISCLSEIKKQLDSGGKASLEIPVNCSGKEKWAMMGVTLSDDGSELYCSLSDISAIKSDCDYLRESKNHYDIIMGLTHNLVYEWDLHKSFLHCSKDFTKTIGIQTKEMGDFPDCIANIDLVYKDDVEKFIDTFHNMRNGQEHSVIDCRIKDASGGYVWYRNSMTAVKNTSGAVERVLGVLSDINEDRRRLERAEESSMKDPLTQLYNKKSTDALIRQYLSRASVAAFMIIDIDNFKSINDTLGHLYGDSVLSKFAQILHATFRSGDICGRIGGDEFAVLMADTDSIDLAAEKAKKILSGLHRSFMRNDAGCQISASIGISFFPKDGADIVSVMEKADQALYRVKNSGKSGFAFYGDMTEKDASADGGGEDAEANAEQPETSVVRHENFIENVSEYILDVFYRYDDVREATDAVLDLIGSLYGIDRIFIYEFSRDEHTAHVSFEWCAHGIPSLSEQDRFLCVDPWENIREHLDENNIFCMEDPSVDYTNVFRTFTLNSRGDKAALVSYVTEGSRRRAVVGFEYCRKPHKFTDDEKKVISLITRTILIFILRARDRQDSEMSKVEQANRETALDVLDNIIIVSDIATYNILFANRAARLAFGLGDSCVGKKCYAALKGFDAPCPTCPNTQVTDSSPFIFEDSDARGGRSFLYREKIIEWSGKKAKIVSGIDITAKESERRRLAEELNSGNTVISGLSALISAPTLEEAMDSMLQNICEYYDACSSFIIEADGKNTISLTYSWRAKGVYNEDDLHKKVPLDSEPFWKEVFTTGDDIFVDDISAICVKSKEQYNSLKKRGISSLYAVRLILGPGHTGFLCVANPGLRKNAAVLRSIALIADNEITRRRKFETFADPFSDVTL